MVRGRVMGNGDSMPRTSKKPTDLSPRIFFQRTGQSPSPNRQLDNFLLRPLGSCFCPLLGKETSEKREIGSKISSIQQRAWHIRWTNAQMDGWVVETVLSWRYFGMGWRRRTVLNPSRGEVGFGSVGASSWHLPTAQEGSSGEVETGPRGAYRTLWVSWSPPVPHSPGMKGNSTWSLGQCPDPKPWSQRWGPGVRLKPRWPQEFLFLDPLKCKKGSTGS